MHMLNLTRLITYLYCSVTGEVLGVGKRMEVDPMAASTTFLRLKNGHTEPAGTEVSGAKS